MRLLIHLLVVGSRLVQVRAHIPHHVRDGGEAELGDSELGERCGESSLLFGLGDALEVEEEAVDEDGFDAVEEVCPESTRREGSQGVSDTDVAKMGTAGLMATKIFCDA